MSSSGYDRLYHRFKDIDEVEYLLEVYRTGYSTSYEIKYANGDDPVSLAYKGSGKGDWDNTFIQGKELVFKFLIPRADLAIADDLLESQYKDWNVKLSKGAVVLFQGFLKPENMYKRFEVNPPYIEVELSATDGLAELKDVNFYQPFEDPETGTLLLLQVIQYALTPVGLELPFKIQLSTRETVNQAADTCPLMQIRCNAKRFYDINKDEEGLNREIKPVKCWEAIEIVLKTFNCKLFQFNGYYWIVNQLELSSYTFGYSWEFVYLFRNAWNPLLDISDYNYFPNVEQQKLQPLKSILTNIVNTHLGKSTQTDFTDWLTVWSFSDEDGARWYSTVENTAGNLEGTIHDTNQPFMYLTNYIPITRDPDGGREYLRFKGYIKLVVWDPVTGLFVRDGRIDDWDIKLRITKDGGETWSEYVKIGPPILGQWKGFDTKANEVFRINESGDYGVQLFIDSLKGKNHFDYALFEFAGFEITQYDAVDGNDFNPTYVNSGPSYFQVNVNGYEDLEQELKLFDSVSINDTGSLMVFDDPDWVPTQTWNTYGGSEAAKIVDINARLILRNRSEYKNYLRATIVDRGYNIEFYNILTIQSKNYAFTNYERNFKTGEIHAELIELLTGNLGEFDDAEDVTLKVAPIPITPGTTEPETEDVIYQDNHGFEVGDVIRCTQTPPPLEVIYYKALASDIVYATSIGVVSEVMDEHTFRFASYGLLPMEVFPVTPGLYYYLSPTDAGKMVTSPTYSEYEIEQAIGFGTEKGLFIEIDARNLNFKSIVEKSQTPSGVPFYMHAENSSINDSDSSGDSSGGYDPSDYDRALILPPDDPYYAYACPVRSRTSPKVIKRFITDIGVPKTTLLPAGGWFFETWWKASVQSALCGYVTVYKRSAAGVETELFHFYHNFLRSPGTVTKQDHCEDCDAFILDEDDRLVFEYSAYSIILPEETLTLYVEGNYRTNVKIPIFDTVMTINSLKEVVTDMSVTGKGTDEEPVKLVNDEETPGADKYYGTDAIGVKGYHDLPEGGGGIDDVYVEPDPTFPIDYLYYDKDSVKTFITDIPKADGIVAGGHISWLGGLMYQIDPTAWYKAGNLYTIGTSTLTLNPADSGDDRIDALILDTVNGFTFIEGTPAENPMRPTIDAGTDIFLTEVYIAAGATEPDPIPTDELVYNENVEWAVTASGPTINADYTGEHYVGSKSINVGGIANFEYIQFEAGIGETFDTADWINIIGNIKLKATMNTRKMHLSVVFLLNGVTINNPEKFTIDGATTAWQNLALTFSRINFFGTEFNQIRFYFYKTTGGDFTGFYLDYIKLESGIVQPVVNQSVQLIGDVLGNGFTGSPIPTVLKVVNANIGTYGDGTHVARITVDAKGRITAVEEVVITPGMSEVETAGSVVGVGDLSDPVTLDGDEDTPGNSKYYGTDGAGAKGFHDLPEPGGAITTDGSVVGTGDASDPVMLDGDEDSPGNSQYYGTDSGGTKGFHDLPGGAALSIISESSGSFTISSTHLQKYCRVNYASGVNATMPADTFSAGDWGVFEQTGNGAVTVVADSGVTVNGYDGLTTYGQYASIMWVCVASNTFIVIAGTGF